MALIVGEGMDCGWTIPSKIKGGYDIITSFSTILYLLFSKYILVYFKFGHPNH